MLIFLFEVYSKNPQNFVSNLIYSTHNVYYIIWSKILLEEDVLEYNPKRCLFCLHNVMQRKIQIQTLHHNGKKIISPNTSRI